MSATLEYGATHGWERGVAPVRNYIPASEDEIAEVRKIGYELAQLTNNSLHGKKTIRPPKKTVKKILSIDAGRMF